MGKILCTWFLWLIFSVVVQCDGHKTVVPFLIVADLGVRNANRDSLSKALRSNGCVTLAASTKQFISFNVGLSGAETMKVTEEPTRSADQFCAVSAIGLIVFGLEDLKGTLAMLSNVTFGTNVSSSASFDTTLRTIVVRRWSFFTALSLMPVSKYNEREISFSHAINGIGIKLASKIKQVTKDEESIHSTLQEYFGVNELSVKHLPRFLQNGGGQSRRLGIISPNGGRSNKNGVSSSKIRTAIEGVHKTKKAPSSVSHPKPPHRAANAPSVVSSSTKQNILHTSPSVTPVVPVKVQHSVYSLHHISYCDLFCSEHLPRRLVAFLSLPQSSSSSTTTTTTTTLTPSCAAISDKPLIETKVIGIPNISIALTMWGKEHGITWTQLINAKSECIFSESSSTLEYHHELVDERHNEKKKSHQTDKLDPSHVSEAPVVSEVFKSPYSKAFSAPWKKHVALNDSLQTLSSESNLTSLSYAQKLELLGHVIRIYGTYLINPLPVNYSTALLYYKERLRELEDRLNQRPPWEVDHLIYEELSEFELAYMTLSTEVFTSLKGLMMRGKGKRGFNFEPFLRDTFFQNIVYNDSYSTAYTYISSQYCHLIDVLDREEDTLKPVSNHHPKNPTKHATHKQPTTSTDTVASNMLVSSLATSTANTAVCLVGSTRTLVRADLQDALFHRFYGGWGIDNLWTFAVLSNDDEAIPNKHLFENFLSKLNLVSLEWYQNMTSPERPCSEQHEEMQLNQWSACYRSILAYEAGQGKQFDAVIKIRPDDFWYGAMAPHCAFNVKSTVYISNQRDRWSDQWFSIPRILAPFVLDVVHIDMIPVCRDDGLSFFQSPKTMHFEEMIFNVIKEHAAQLNIEVVNVIMPRILTRVPSTRIKLVLEKCERFLWYVPPGACSRLVSGHFLDKNNKLKQLPYADNYENKSNIS